MRIENEAFLYGPLPKPFSDSMKVGEGVLGSIFGPEVAIGDRRVALVSEGKILGVQIKDYLGDNLVGRMAVASGLDVSELFTPSKVAAPVKAGTGSGELYLSADYFRPLYTLNRTDAGQRGDVSNGCVYAFSTIVDVLLSQLPKEVPFPTDPNLAQHVVKIIPEYLREKDSAATNPLVDKFAGEFELFMEANASNLSFTVKGFEIHIYLRGDRVFTILSGQDQAIRSMLRRPVVDKFIESMRKRTTWFSPDVDLELENVKSGPKIKAATQLLGEMPHIKTVGDVYRAYKSSELGGHVGELIIRKLIVEKHNVEEPAAQEEPVFPNDFSGAGFDYEELGGEPLRVNRPKKIGKTRRENYKD